MKTYNTQAEVDKDIKNGVLAIEGDVSFKCHISVDANILVTKGDISARNITAWNINAGDITARDITAGNINARDINAWNITARDITAGNITYYAFCNAYKNIKCTSIEAKRTPHQKPICLDGKLTVISNEQPISPQEVIINGAVYVLKQL